MTIVQVPGFLSLTISIVVFFAGASLNKIIYSRVSQLS